MSKKTLKDYSNKPEMGKFNISQLDESEHFLIINVEDKWRIGLANRWVSKQIFNSAEEAQEYIKQKPWELIANTICVYAEFMIQEKVQKNCLK